MDQGSFDDYRKELRDDFQFRLKMERRADKAESRIESLDQRIANLERKKKPDANGGESQSVNTVVKVERVKSRTQIIVAVILALQMIAIAALALFK